MICTPSRAALMTGRYASSVGMSHSYLDPGQALALPVGSNNKKETRKENTKRKKKETKMNASTTRMKVTTTALIGPA